MTRLLIIGTGPLLSEGVRFFSGQCLRTWHLTKPLLDAGHEIHLVTLPIDDRDFEPASDEVLVPATYHGLEHHRAQSNRIENILPAIQSLCDEVNPEAIIGINPFSASVACQLRSDAPLWADMNGYVPAEGQTRGRIYSDDTPLEHFWEMEWNVVRRGDRISTVTRRQSEATLGELAMAGRLNRHTFDYPFVHFIPNAVAEHFANLTAPPPHMRGRVIPQESFILLWCGGFNTWTDIDLLHDALERFMDQSPDVHFVATGGPIAGHDEKTFTRFKELSQQSPNSDRRHLLGWVESEVVDALMFESDLGINIDSPNWETHFGARNRLINMMACGLPVLTTLGTEISEDLSMENAAITVSMKNPISLTEALIMAHAGDLGDLKELGQRGQAMVKDRFSCTATTRDLVEWAAAPERAPDQLGKRDSSLEFRVQHLDRAAYLSLLYDRADLLAIRSRWIWRLAKWLKRSLTGKRSD